jgi:hypothetical protein
MMDRELQERGWGGREQREGREGEEVDSSA